MAFVHLLEDGFLRRACSKVWEAVTLSGTAPVTDGINIMVTETEIIVLFHMIIQYIWFSLASGMCMTLQMDGDRLC